MDMCVHFIVNGALIYRSVTLALLGIWSTPRRRQQLLERMHGWPQRLVFVSPLKVIIIRIQFSSILPKSFWYTVWASDLKICLVTISVVSVKKNEKI